VTVQGVRSSVNFFAIFASWNLARFVPGDWTTAIERLDEVQRWTNDTSGLVFADSLYHTDEFI
jgi:hypothetical protein